MKSYDPKNWYWIVAGDATKVYSSLQGDYVLVTDPTFVGWKSDGSIPTSIDSEKSLGSVLAPLLLRPSNSGVLDGYQEEQADSAVVKLLFKVIFNQENRLRVLEGKPTVTAAQARAFVKGLM